MKPVSFFKKEQKGQSIIEFSMMIPVFLLIVMFLIEICFGIYYKMVLNQLIFNVARVVSISRNDSTTVRDNKIQAVLNAYQNQGAIRFNVKDSTIFNLSWTQQTVNVVYQIITIKASYNGLKLPFIGTLPISDQLIFPYVDTTIVLP